MNLNIKNFIKKSKEKLNKTYFIAEIGVNHNGKLSLAKKMILAAKRSGANAVKFQTFKAKDLVAPQTKKVAYQKNTTSPNESHYQMIKSLELSEKMHHLISKFCNKHHIEFISTPYGIEAAKFLDRMGFSVFKTASADIVDLEMHEYLAKKKKYVIISVGIATIKEINYCINIYKKYNNKNIILLHCVSNYPCSLNSLNLNVLKLLSKKFKYNIGYSDHSIGHHASVLSVALGAKIIEKHFTTNKKLPGPDQTASVLPHEFKKMVQEVDKAHLILGSEKKICQPEEKQMSLVSRKSLTIVNNLKKGQILKRKHITLKRPGTGLYYKDFNKILGRNLRYNLKKNYQPLLKDFK